MKLENIAPGSRVSGIAGEAAVEILSVRAYGPDAVEVAWKGPDGLGERIMFRDDEPRLRMEAAARLLTAMGPDNGEAARLLAYRLYDICERAGRAAEAQVWNSLAQEWPLIEDAAIQAKTGLREEALPFGGRDGA